MKLALHSRLALITLVPAFILIILVVSILTTQQIAGTDTEARKDASLASRHYSRLLLHAALTKQPYITSGFRWQTSNPEFKELLNSALYAERARSVKLYHPNGDLAAHLGARYGDDLLAPIDPMQRNEEAVAGSMFATRHRITLPGDDDRHAGWVDITYDFSDTRIDAYGIAMTNGGIAIIALTLLYFLVIRVARAAAEPILRIVEATQYIREGEYDTRIETSSSSQEIRALEYTINHLVAELQRLHEDMQQSIDIATQDLKTGLEGFERQNIKLEQALKEAQSGAKIKSRFLANMSHEMRTPLNAIHGLSQLMTKSNLPKKEQERMQTIHASADWLLTLINDLLDFSKIEAKKLEIEQREFVLRESLESVMSMLSPQAHQKHLDLALMLFEDVPSTLIGDEVRIKQVITNLVSNAIKFTEKGSVVVRVMLEDEGADYWRIMITVSDTGKGMSKEQCQKLFSSYEQGASDVARQYGGTGLGLSISRKLVELMGGDIQVDSAVGEGSVFSLTVRAGKASQAVVNAERGPVWVCESNELRDNALVNVLRYAGFTVNRENSCADTPEGESLFLGIDDPKTLPWQRLLQLKSSRNLTVVLPWHHEEAVEQLINEGIHTLVHPVVTQDLLVPSEETKRQQPQKLPTVLAVDDHPANLFLLKELLEEAPIRLITANGGYAALDMVKQEPVDLVLMDIRMPDLDGVETTQRIRRLPQYGNLPIIALTAHALADERRRLLEQGMNDYLSKPINLNNLEQALQRWLKFDLSEEVIETSTEQILGDPDEPVSFDSRLALSRCGGKSHLAKHMMQDFLSALPTMQRDVEKVIDEREQCLDAVHKLHGASKLCGLPKLSALLESCEAALKDEQADYLPIWQQIALEAAVVLAWEEAQWLSWLEAPGLEQAPNSTPLT